MALDSPKKGYAKLVHRFLCKRIVKALSAETHCQTEYHFVLGWKLIFNFHKTKRGCFCSIDKILLLKAGHPPLDLSFWTFLTFLHHGIEDLERHFL